MRLRSELSPIDGSMHQWCMSLLNNLQSYTSFEALAAEMPYTFNGSEQSIFFAGGTTTPAALAVMDVGAAQLLVVAGGTESVTQLAALMAGWFAPLLPAGGGQQPPYVAFADNIASQVVQAPGFVWSTVRLVGFSYGGCTVQNIPWQLGNWNATTDIKVYSYGAPKCVRNRDRGLVSADMARRVVAIDDPVPRFPPNLVQWRLPIIALVSNSEARNWSDWIQPVTALVFDAEGDMGTGDENSGASFNTPAAYITLAQWISDCFGTPSHSLASYTTRLNLTPTPTVPSRQPQTTSLRLTGGLPTASQLNVQRTVEQVAQASIVEANPGLAVTNAVQQITPIRGGKFHGGKMLGHNAIFYEDQFVMYVRRKRTLRSTVRRLNQIGLTA